MHKLFREAASVVAAPPPGLVLEDVSGQSNGYKVSNGEISADDLKQCMEADEQEKSGMVKNDMGYDRKAVLIVGEREVVSVPMDLGTLDNKGNDLEHSDKGPVEGQLAAQWYEIHDGSDDGRAEAISDTETQVGPELSAGGDDGSAHGYGCAGSSSSLSTTPTPQVQALADAILASYGGSIEGRWRRKPPCPVASPAAEEPGSDPFGPLGQPALARVLEIDKALVWYGGGLSLEEWSSAICELGYAQVGGRRIFLEPAAATLEQAVDMLECHDRVINRFQGNEIDKLRSMDELRVERAFKRRSAWVLRIKELRESIVVPG